MKFWSFFLFGSTLFATVNEPLRLELFSGYRNDRIHWHLQDGGSGILTYRELDRDIQYWENGLSLKAIHRDLSFYLRGAYGAFGRGPVYQRYAAALPSIEEPRFTFNTDGWTADGMGYFGYAINLTADRTYKTILTPLIGYGGYFERLERKQGSPEPFVSQSQSGQPFAMFSRLPSDYRLVWYGFLFGGAFTIEPGGMAVFHVGYSYHLLRLRQHTAFQNQIVLGAPPVSDVETTSRFTVRSSGCKGHSGWAQMDFILSRFWRMGFGGQIHYFFTNVLETKIHRQTQSLTPASVLFEKDLGQKFKLRWTSFSGWVQISREL